MPRNKQTSPSDQHPLSLFMCVYNTPGIEREKESKRGRDSLCQWFYGFEQRRIVIHNAPKPHGNGKPAHGSVGKTNGNGGKAPEDEKMVTYLCAKAHGNGARVNGNGKLANGSCGKLNGNGKLPHGNCGKLNGNGKRLRKLHFL